jgi:hypothetical protein
MARPSKYPLELRERAVRLVLQSRGDYSSEYEAIRWIAGKLGLSRWSRCAVRLMCGGRQALSPKAAGNSAG